MTDIPRGITARRLIKALHQDGFTLKRARRSHRIYAHPDGHRLSDTFPIGTLKAMITDTRWDEDDLRRLALF